MDKKNKIKVLWFSGTPSLLKKNAKGYNGVGWVESLEFWLSKHQDLELAICFLDKNSNDKTQRESTVYYPIQLYNGILNKINHNLFYSKYDKVEVEKFLKIIDDFKPDVIHVFGTENSYGLISKYTKIPLIIHIQGVLNPSLNAYFPPGVSKWDYFQYLNIYEAIVKIKTYFFFKHNSLREKLIFNNCKFYMGRTEWDKALISLYSPSARYFHCDEILRPPFYKALPWKKPKNTVFSIMSTISKVDYKGFDLILKTCDLLKQYAPFKFEWKVFGIKEYRFWERKLKIKAKENDLILMGIVTADTLVKNMSSANVFVHPSYIDNSPNSICEAQLLGLPVISTYVGGIVSIIENNVTGILVPPNDPHSLATEIIKFYLDNDERSSKISRSARYRALERHNIQTIVSKNVNIYKTILNHKND